MINVLLVAPVPPPCGGIANWTLLLSEKISSDKSSKLAAFINTAPRKGRVFGRSWWERIFGQGFDILRLRRELNDAIDENKPDVVHIATSAGLSIFRDIALIRAAKKRDIPVVYHLHFGRTPELAQSKNIEWRLFIRAIALVDAMVAIDNHTHDALVDVFPQKKIYNIPNFMNVNDVIREREVRKEILFLGWCKKEKGVEELLSAWEQLSGIYPEWSLRLIGPYDESYIKDLKVCYNTDSVIFGGELEHSEAMHYLSRASIFTLPSHTEGFPTVVLEAMAYSKPIVATDVGAIAQMLDQGAGVVIPAKNTERLVAALSRMIDSKAVREIYGSAARARFESQYTADIVFEKLRNMWCDIALTPM